MGQSPPGGGKRNRTLGPKRLQLLRELIPDAAVFGVLANPSFPDMQSQIAELQAAARKLGLQLIVGNARTDRDLEAAFTTFSQQHVGASQPEASFAWVVATPFLKRRQQVLKPRY
jgi:hypothetical protein